MTSNAPFNHVSVVLVRPQHSGNIGAVARSIANHGLGQLVLVDLLHLIRSVPDGWHRMHITL